MNRQICVTLPNLEEDLKERLTQAAQKAGFAVVFTTDKALRQDPTPLKSCEIFSSQDINLLRHTGDNLKWYACPNAGVDAMCNDPTYFADPNCILTNGAGAYGVTISEHLVMLTLMLMRQMPTYLQTNAQQAWGVPTPLPMRSIRGCSVTVVGTGNIGSTYAQAMRALGAKRIIGLSRSGIARDTSYDQVLPISELDGVLPESEVVMLSLPNTPETQGILSRQRLAMLKPNALILNVGRGTAIDQEALIDALNGEQIAGAALDVMVPEPLPAGHPLWTTKNLLLTPHIAGNLTLRHTRETIIDTICENLPRYLSGEPLLHQIDRTKGY